MSTETATTPRIAWEEPNAVQVRVVLDDGYLPTRRAVRNDARPTASHPAGGHGLDRLASPRSVACALDPELLNQDMPDDFKHAFDAAPARLRDFHFDHEGALSFVYTYDSGDNWHHTETPEKLLAVEPAPKTATCIEGARCCPPEDVGGMHGYFEFVRVLLGPELDETDEQKHLKRWCGSKFNP